MEQSFTEVQENCEELQLLLMQREDQLCSLHQELTDTTSRLQVCTIPSCAVLQ